VISLSWNSSFEPNSYDANEHIGALVSALKEMPRHIARKHAKAAMRRTLKHGIPILRRNTPPLGTRRGRRKSGQRAKSTGDLRRRVTTKAGQTGNNGDFGAFVWGVLGYRIKGQDRKPIWLNFGTSHGVRAYDMIGKTMAEMGPVAAEKLAAELAIAVEKAANELASKKNPGMSKRGRAAGL
jgi:hypothetical protein